MPLRRLSKPDSARHGPSAVTATAVHVVKAIACRIMGVPQARSLALPEFLATPNRAHFRLMHPDIRNYIESSTDIKKKVNTELRQELDKEVNRVIRQDLPINIHSNLTIVQALERFGNDVIDRFHDINEPKFTQFLNQQYIKALGKPMYTNAYEANYGPFLEKWRYRRVDGIEVDMKEAVSSFLKEVKGNALDLLPSKELQFLRRKKTWMEHQKAYLNNIEKKLKEEEEELSEAEEEKRIWNGLEPENNINLREQVKPVSLKEEDIALVLNKEWTSKLGVFHTLTSTDWEKAPEDLRINIIEIPNLFGQMMDTTINEEKEKPLKKKAKGKSKGKGKGKDKDKSTEEEKDEEGEGEETEEKEERKKDNEKKNLEIATKKKLKGGNDTFVGICLSASRTGRYLNSENIKNPCMYLKSTGELGRIVITQTRYIGHKLCPKQHIYLDVFPGYDAKIMGPNPYVMSREIFNLPHLASIIP